MSDFSGAEMQAEDGAAAAAAADEPLSTGSQGAHVKTLTNGAGHNIALLGVSRSGELRNGYLI